MTWDMFVYASGWFIAGSLLVWVCLGFIAIWTGIIWVLVRLVRNATKGRDHNDGNTGNAGP